MKKNNKKSPSKKVSKKLTAKKQVKKSASSKNSPVKKERIKKTFSDPAIVKTPNPNKGGLNTKSWIDACAFYGYDPKSLPIVKHLPKPIQNYLVNHYMMVIIIGAINLDKKPDWSNINENKNCLWTGIQTEKNGKTNPSGFGFSGASLVFTFTHSDVGARQTFRTTDGMWHFYKHFEKMYVTNQLFTE